MTDELQKPKRSFSRALTTVGVIIPAWGAWYWSMWVGKEMASIVVPSCVLLIAGAALGYQGVGHLDFRSQLARPRPDARRHERSDRRDRGPPQDDAEGD